MKCLHGPIWGFRDIWQSPPLVSPGQLGETRPLVPQAHRPKPSLAVVAVASASGGDGRRRCRKRLLLQPLLPYPSSLSTYPHLRFPFHRLLHPGPKTSSILHFCCIRLSDLVSKYKIAANQSCVVVTYWHLISNILLDFLWGRDSNILLDYKAFSPSCQNEWTSCVLGSRLCVNIGREKSSPWLLQNIAFTTNYGSTRSLIYLNYKVGTNHPIYTRYNVPILCTKIHLTW